MKKIALLLITTSFFLFSVFKETAGAVGGVGESCCNTGYTPVPTRISCVNDQVFTSCATFASSVCGIARTVCTPLGCTVPATCDSSIGSWCSDQASVGGAAAIDAVTVCATIASTMHISTPGFTIACVGVVGVPLSILLSILNGLNITDPPACTGGNICKWSATPPVCAVGAAGPTIEPYNPECDSPAGPGVKTALGCLPTDAEKLINPVTGVGLSRWVIGFGAGIGFLLGIYGAFLIATASGDPEKVQAGKELITSVIMGVVVITFAVFLMKLGGVTILGLFGD